MSDTKHTPEPWRIGKCSASMGVVVSDTPIPEIGGSDATDYYGGHLIGESITLANARRIVACVNACAGMDNPEKEIAALRAATEKAREALKDIGGYTGDSPVSTDWRGIVRDVGGKARSALAALEEVLK